MMPNVIGIYLLLVPGIVGFLELGMGELIIYNERGQVRISLMHLYFSVLLSRASLHCATKPNNKKDHLYRRHIDVRKDRS